MVCLRGLQELALTDRDAAINRREVSHRAGSWLQQQKSLLGEQYCTLYTLKCSLRAHSVIEHNTVLFAFVVAMDAEVLDSNLSNHNSVKNVAPFSCIMMNMLNTIVLTANIIESLH